VLGDPVTAIASVAAVLPAGATLRVLATDPASMADFRAYCSETGHELLEAAQDADGEVAQELAYKALRAAYALGYQDSLDAGWEERNSGSRLTPIAIVICFC
jgi:TusA-related sulfurtransferase